MPFDAGAKAQEYKQAGERFTGTFVKSHTTVQEAVAAIEQRVLEELIREASPEYEALKEEYRKTTVEFLRKYMAYAMTVKAVAQWQRDTLDEVTSNAVFNPFNVSTGAPLVGATSDAYGNFFAAGLFGQKQESSSEEDLQLTIENELRGIEVKATSELQHKMKVGAITLEGIIPGSSKDEMFRNIVIIQKLTEKMENFLTVFWSYIDASRTFVTIRSMDLHTRLRVRMLIELIYRQTRLISIESAGEEKILDVYGHKTATKSYTVKINLDFSKDLPELMSLYETHTSLIDEMGTERLDKRDINIWGQGLTQKAFFEAIKELSLAPLGQLMGELGIGITNT